MDSRYVGKFVVDDVGGPAVNMQKIAPNQAGEYEVRGTFVATSNTHTIRMGNGFSRGTVWYDAIAVVEATSPVNPYRGEYFDGDTPDDSFAEHEWTGAPNASTSTKTVADSPEQDVPPFYGYVKADNSKAELEIRYRSGWVA